MFGGYIEIEERGSGVGILDFVLDVIQYMN